jgi:hypothetical protein
MTAEMIHSHEIEQLYLFLTRIERSGVSCLSSAPQALGLRSRVSRCPLGQSAIKPLDQPVPVDLEGRTCGLSSIIGIRLG